MHLSRGVDLFGYQIVLRFGWRWRVFDPDVIAVFRNVSVLSWVTSVLNAAAKECCGIVFASLARNRADTCCSENNCVFLCDCGTIPISGYNRPFYCSLFVCV